MNATDKQRIAALEKRVAALEDAVQRAWSALDENNILAAYDALDV